MVRAARKESKAGLYHVMARGVGRCIIYEDDTDRETFLRLLDRLLMDLDITLHAWCLMDNHYHLLVESPLDRLAIFMRKLNSSYAQFFNERHGRVGHLFQGRYRSEAIEADEYYLAVVRYIHRNPVEAGICETCSYPWSSFDGYCEHPRLVSNQLFLSMLSADAFEEFHEYGQNEKRCLEIDQTYTRITNEEALAVARRALDDVRPEEVAGLERSRRNEALRTLKQARLSLRQIERLTGVSKSVVAEA